MEIECAAQYKLETRSIGTLLPSIRCIVIRLLTSHSAISLVLHCHQADAKSNCALLRSLLVHHPISRIYETGVVPDEMLKSVIVTLPKKPIATECVNFRTTSLMSHVLKLLLRIMVQRIEKKAHFLFNKEQFGFMPDRGTRNSISCLRVIADGLLNHQQKLFVCFIDFVKAFDKVRHKKFIEALDEAGIDDKDHRLLQNIYWKQKQR